MGETKRAHPEKLVYNLQKKKKKKKRGASDCKIYLESQVTSHLRGADSSKMPCV